MICIGALSIQSSGWYHAHGWHGASLTWTRPSPFAPRPASLYQARDSCSQSSRPADTAEIQPRYSRDIPEICPRYRRGSRRVGNALRLDRQLGMCEVRAWAISRLCATWQVRIERVGDVIGRAVAQPAHANHAWACRDRQMPSHLMASDGMRRIKRRQGGRHGGHAHYIR